MKTGEARDRRRALLPLAVVVLLIALPPLAASGALSPLNDLLSLGHASGQKIPRAETQRPPEPSQVPTPQMRCLPGSRPEPGIQGRVPRGTGDRGLFCNASLISRHGVSGGFKTHRYVDRQGHECAYYDNALLYPTNALRLGGSSSGVTVLDMSNPRRPRKTAQLTSLPMLSPHESVELNRRRGLLAAVLGNPTTYPGLVSIYDLSEDCRHPKHQATEPLARFGHESGFAPDGKTFWATGTAVNAISAIDVTNPRDPHSIWHGSITSHGMSLRADGNRAYLADPGGEMVTLDTSEIQARKKNPQAREISRLTWRNASIPQNAISFTQDGKPYVLEIDEYDAGTSGGGDGDAVGAARIIDVSNERRPRVVSNLRLEVNQRENHAAAQGDPGARSPVQGYAAHYCDVSSPVDPKVVACSFIVSGLRVFDISELTKPKEIAYYVLPTRPRNENFFQASNFAMARPAIIPSRREIWNSDGAQGFYAVRVDKRVWPGGGGGGDSGRTCAGRRATIVGTPGPDRLVGTRGRDVILGLGGRDRIRAGQGDDIVCAGKGNDRVHAGSGNDRVYGQAGRDRLRGERGGDRLRGGSGKDRIAGGSGRDRLRGERGGDRLYGGFGRDRLSGGSGNDLLFGGPGRDLLRGGPGSDRLVK